MCFDYTGRIVKATTGRDKGKLFYVLKTREDTGRVLLADGKRRKASHPKEKSVKHVEPITTGEERFPHPVTQKLKSGETVSDRELIRALCAFKEEMKLGKR